MSLPVRKKNPWFAHCIALLFLIFGLLHCASWCVAQEQAQQDGAIATYQKNRQHFIDEQQKNDQAFKTQADALKQEIAGLKQDIEQKRQALNRIEAEITQTSAGRSTLAVLQSGASFFLFPLVSLYSQISLVFSGQGQSILFLIFLSLTVLNVFLYLLFKQELFYRRYRVLLIIAVVLLIGSIASPLFADEKDKRSEVFSKLKAAEEVLSRTDHQRFIEILEKKPTQRVRVPPLQSGDSLFKVHPEVTVGSPEYWFTLAALYTHENMKRKALDAVKKITQESWLQETEEHQEILINSIKYLIQNQQTEDVMASIDSLSGTITNVNTLLKMAVLLKENSMQVSSEKVLGYAILKANTVEDLIKLSKYFQEKDELTKSNEALEKAVGRVQNTEEVLALAKAALGVKKDGLLGKITKAMHEGTTDYRAKMQLVDLLLENGRKEDAVDLVSKIIKEDTSRSQRNVDKLLYMINATLKRNMLPQATTASEALIFLLGLQQAKDTLVQAETKLKSMEGIPDEEKIMLPNFYGLVNEEQGFNDKAEEAYIQSVLGSLATIIDSYGYKFPDSRNDFYLLGRNWVRGNQSELVGQLNKVYSFIEKDFIAKQSAENDKQMQALQEEIQELKNQAQYLDQTLVTTKKKSTSAFIKLVVQAISTMATIIFLVAVAIGCIVLSHRYSRRLSVGKTFGFSMKFCETAGWLQVLSILGVVNGLVTVFVAQFFLIFQMVQENTRQNAAGLPPLPVTVNLSDEPEIVEEQEPVASA